MKYISIVFFLFLTFSCNDDYISEDKEYLSEGIDVQLSANINNYKDCATEGSSADVDGLKTWCWTGDLANEINNNTPGAQDPFSNGQLAKSTNYDAGSIVALGGRLHFSVNPTSPTPPGGPDYYNYRSEIRDIPSDVDHPVGTEQWWGFDYKFGEDYIKDELPWILWQTHKGVSDGSNPMTSLWISDTNYNNSNSSQGELLVVNAALSTNSTKITPTGIVPEAGQTLNIVIQLVWGDNNEGLYRVWVDDVLVYSEQERTVYADHGKGGYWKIGIYKWRWQTESHVDSSAALGIHHLNTSIGNLRVIKNSPGECTPNAYDMVKPTIVSDDTCPDDLSNGNSSISIASQGPGSWDGCKLIAGVLDDTKGCVLKLQKNAIGDQYAGYKMVIDLEDPANNISEGDKIAISLDANGVDGNAKFKVFADNDLETPLINYEYGEGQGWYTHTQEVTVPNGADELFLWLYPNMGSTDPGHSLFGNLVVQEVATVFPDPNATYYIDNQRWNVRLGANGGEDAYTTSVNTIGDEVEWKITPSPTAGYYYIDCVGGGNKPRIRTDRSTLADMQSTSSGGTFTRWSLTDVGNGWYYLTTLNVSDYMRLQVNGSGDVRTVTSNSTGIWTRFKFTEVMTSNSTTQ